MFNADLFWKSKKTELYLACYAAASCLQFMHSVNTYLEPPFHVPGTHFTSSIDRQHKHSVSVFLLENGNIVLVFSTSMTCLSVTCYFFPQCVSYSVARLAESLSY